jgi:Kdo2-lipid IVA lauroyltransferase/acyltransferase
MQYITYLLTRAFVELFRFVPFGAMYVLSDGISGLLFRFGYRGKVVYGNLKRCFPEKTESEIKQIAREFYRNLSDITLESIKCTTTPLEEIKHRYRILNYELMNQHLDAGRSVVLSGGHYGNWEWAVITIASGFRGKSIGVYKPLSNKYVNDWMFRTRDRDPKMVLTAMKETYAAVEKYKGENLIFLMVGDQSPSNRKTAHWVNFFGTDTACLSGVDNIARANDFPVFFYDIQRIKRGHYELTLSEIEMKPASQTEGLITQKLMKMLEKQINVKPQDWLWSHRRWKMER